MKLPAFSRRGPLLFLAGCAGVLAAGMAAVVAAGRFAPGREVIAHAALPVQGALGAESADLLFWPEEAWKNAGSGELCPQEELSGALALPWLHFFGLGRGPAPEEPGTVYTLETGEDLCIYVRGLRLADSLPRAWQEAEPGASPDQLMADLAAGARNGRFALCLRINAAGGYDGLPADWQEDAVQRCKEELLYLFNLSNDDQRQLLYGVLSSYLAIDSNALEQVDFPPGPLAEQWAADGSAQFISALQQLQGLIRVAQRHSVETCSRQGWQDPGQSGGAFYNHQDIWADPMPGEAELVRVLEDVGLDVQIVPQKTQVMILFGWQNGSLAVYYDPVLNTFAGCALQT